MGRQFKGKQLSDNLSLSGSFSGSFQGDGSQLTGVGGSSDVWYDGGTYATSSKNLIITGSISVTPGTINYLTASYAISASHEIIKELSSSFADTASYINPLNQDVIINGDLNVTGSFAASGLNYPIIDGQRGDILTTDAAGTLTFDRTRIYAQVKNISGGTLSKGTPVHVTSSVGNLDEVIPASASNALTMPATFILAEDLNNDEEGLGILTGFINNVDTSAFNEGDVVYVGPNGGYTNVKPTGSNLIQNLGIVTKVAVNGSGFIYGSGRSNDTPNLITGNVFYGVGDRSIETPLSDIISGSLFSYSGSFSGSFQGDGSSLTGIEAGTNLTQSLFVSPSGNNGTAVVGDITKPFQTILAATASANIGDTIIVYPGTYSDTNILKDGVNYYFHVGAKIQTSTDWILNGIGAFDYPINIRGAGKFENNDTNTGIGSITANAGGYIEFDEMKTDSINTAYVNSFTVKNNSTDESTLFIRGRMFDSGSNSNNAVFFNITGDNANLVDFEGEIISVKGSRICAQTRYSPGSDNIHLKGNFYCENNTCLDMDGRNNNIQIEGNVATGDGANYYAIRCGGTGDDLHISANVNGAIYVGSGVGDSGATGIILEGRLGGSASPGNLGLLQIYGGNNIINSSIAANETIFYIAGGETIFNGHASLPSNFTDGRFFNITAGKLIFNGMGDSSGGNRNSQNLVSGGHLVIDSHLDYYGTTSPSVPFLTLSGGTLEINNTIRTRTSIAGTSIINMTGGYLKLNGAQLIHATQTGSYGYAIDLNNAAHSGSILNNSFTNLTPFGNTGTFTNEIVGGGTLFYSDKLY